MALSTILARSASTFIYILITKRACPTRIAETSKLIEEIKAHGTILARTRPTFIDKENGLETKISRTFLDLLHLGHEFFVISGHGA